MKVEVCLLNATCLVCVLSVTFVLEVANAGTEGKTEALEKEGMLLRA